MEILLIFGVGILIGIVCTMIMYRVKCIGSLRVDTSDPEGPYLFLELSKDISYIHQKKYITLKVNLKNFIPHK